MEWKKIKIGEFLSESKIESIIPDSNKRITVRLNMNGVQKRPIKNDTKGATKYYKRSYNQFIYGKQNLHKGAFGLIPKELDGFETSSDLPCFDIDTTKCIPEWIIYFLKQGNFYQGLEKIARGAGSKRISPKDFFQIKIPLVSLNEQKILLDKIKVIEEKSIFTINEIQTQQTLLKKLRQSILQEAIEGKLTASWREENCDVESASVLLEKIKAEKERLIGEKKIKKQKPLPPLNEDEIPFDVPDGWVWCRTNDICFSISSGSTPSKEHFINTQEIPYLKVYNIRNQKINFKYKEQFINKKVHNSKLKRSILYPNDIVMNIVGPPLGKIAIIPNDFPEWNCNQAIVYFKLLDSSIHKYLYYFLQELSFLKDIHFKGVAGQDNISITQSRSILFPLPPLKEQKQIVKKIESLFKICDELEEKIVESKKSAEMLMQSVLKEAFRGS